MICKKIMLKIKIYIFPLGLTVYLLTWLQLCLCVQLKVIKFESQLVVKALILWAT